MNGADGGSGAVRYGRFNAEVHDFVAGLPLLTPAAWRKVGAKTRELNHGAYFAWDQAWDVASAAPAAEAAYGDAVAAARAANAGDLAAAMAGSVASALSVQDRLTASQFEVLYSPFSGLVDPLGQKQGRKCGQRGGFAASPRPTSGR